MHVYTGLTLFGALGFNEGAVDDTYGRPHCKTIDTVKRDLLQCQKRPTTLSKETHYSIACRFKAEGFVNKGDVIVDRLGHTTHGEQHLSFDGFPGDRVSPLVSTVTSDDIQLVNPLPLEPFHDLVNVLIWGVSTRRAENGAAALVDV